MSKTLLERAHIIRDEVAEAANTAYRVGQLLADMIVMLQQSSGDYLSSSHDDTAHGHITFAKGASVRNGLDVEGATSLGGGATFGDFRSGIVGGRGGRIDGDGNAEVESLTVRSYLRATELLINRITAIEGDWLMTESGTVEHVEALGSGRYRLRLRRRWDNDYTAFAPLDILKGVVNTMAARALGVVDAPDASAPLYATSWMLVQDVDLTTNTIGVQLYDDDPAQIPSGRNTAPVVGMNLARWGNQRNPERQSCLYLSSREGRIVHLSHVDSPILSDSDVSSSFGSVPDFLRQMLGDVLAQDQDYVYARGLIVQDIIRLGADSLPIAEIVDRGVWKSDATYYHKSRNAETAVYEISDVWHEGAKWRCLASSQGVAPSESRPTQWLLLQAAPKDGRDGTKGDKGSGTYIRYSNDGGKTFTPSAKSDFTDVSDVGRNLLLGTNTTIRGVKAPMVALRLSRRLKIGETYTLSYKYKGRVGKWTTGYIGGGIYCFPAQNMQTDGEWEVYSQTLTILDGDPNAPKNTPLWYRYYQLRNMFVNFYVGNDNDNVEREIKDVKLEVGSVATPYSPAPEDLEMGLVAGDWMGTCQSDNGYPKASVSDYTWSKIKGAPGSPGSPGAPGAPGKDGKNGRDGLTTQANMLHGTDFKGRLSDVVRAGRWCAQISDNSAFSKGEQYADMTSPIFGADVMLLSSPGNSNLSSAKNEYSDLVQQLDGKLIPGQQYIFSVYARSRRSNSCKFWMIAYPAGPHTSFVATKEWQRFSISFSATSEACNFYLRLWNNQGNKPDGSGVYFSAPKLELDGAATPWCLSEDDKRGERGSSLRPRGMWSDLKEGTRFSAGTDGDPFLDVVTMSTAAGTVETYYCTQSHAKSNATAPRADSAYWRKGDSFEFISTRYALIGSANIGDAEIRQLRTAPEGHDRVVSIGAEQRTYAAGNAYPSIVQGFRQEGDQRIAVLEFYDGKTGALLYNLGPNGIFSSLKRVGNKWERAGLMWVGEYCTIRQLYDWVVRNTYPDRQLGQPDMAHPEFGYKDKRVQIGELGFGLWFTEGYTKLNNLGDGGETLLYNVSRRGQPLYSSNPLFSLKPPVNGKRVFMVSDASIDLYNRENYGPNDIFVNSDGSENGDISLTVPPTGWYATRHQTMKDTGYSVYHSELGRDLRLFSLELMRINDGFVTDLHTVYFAREDANPLGGQTQKAQFGRDSRGNAQQHLIP